MILHGLITSATDFTEFTINVWTPLQDLFHDIKVYYVLVATSFIRYNDENIYYWSLPSKKINRQTPAICLRQV